MKMLPTQEEIFHKFLLENRRVKFHIPQLAEDNFLMRKFKKLHVDRIILPDYEFSVAASLFPFQHIRVGETEELLSLM